MGLAPITDDNLGGVVVEAGMARPELVQTSMGYYD